MKTLMKQGVKAALVIGMRKLIKMEMDGSDAPSEAASAVQEYNLLMLNLMLAIIV